MRKVIRSRRIVVNNVINGIDSLYPASSKNLADDSLAAPGFMGVFMTGLFQEFDQPGTFTWGVPTGITKIRVRVLGRGSIGHSYQGGSGGGYAHGVLAVTPGEVFTIKVPDVRANGLVQAEFGNLERGILLRATNGSNGAQALGGIGYGGDYQSIGGAGVGAGSAYKMVGSASGSQIAKVGGVGLSALSDGAPGAKGNGGVLGTNYAGGAVGSATSTSNGSGASLIGLVLPPNFPRFKLDGLYGAGNTELPGAGGSSTAFAGICGGAGSKLGTSLSVVYGGGLQNIIGGNPLITARGLVVIEY